MKRTKKLVNAVAKQLKISNEEAALELDAKNFLITSLEVTMANLQDGIINDEEAIELLLAATYVVNFDPPEDWQEDNDDYWLYITAIECEHPEGATQH